MFDYIYEWLQNIAFYLVLVTAVLHAVPDRDYKKYIRFFTGLVLILMLLTPVLKVFGTEIRIEDFSFDDWLNSQSVLEKLPAADFEDGEYKEMLQDAGITGEQTAEGPTEGKKEEEIEVEEIQIDW